MKLREVLDDITDGTEIYIGARTGWLFIGTKNEFLKNNETINQGIKQSIELDIKDRSRLLKKTKGKVTASKIKKVIDGLKELNSQIVDLLERDVINQYSGHGDGSWRIIIEGDEVTKVWMKEEYSIDDDIFNLGSTLNTYYLREKWK